MMASEGVEPMYELDAYDVGAIKVLNGPGEAVRRRPRMYLGSLDSSGMTGALVGVLTDVMNTAPFPAEVRVCVMGARHVRVEQQAWGVRPADLEPSCNVLGTGHMAWSERPLGVWTSMTVARSVSESFEVITHHEGERWMLLCQDEYTGEPRRIGTTGREGMSWSMTFSDEVFEPGAGLDFELLQRACEELSVICAGVRVVGFDERTGASFEAHRPSGIVDLVADALPGAAVFSCEVSDESSDLGVRVAIGWGDTLDSLTIEDGYSSAGHRVRSGGHVGGVLGGVMESLCVLARRGEETPLCWDARGALRGAHVAIWIGGDAWSYEHDTASRCPALLSGVHLTDPRAYELAARAVARALPAFLNRHPELRDELLRRVLV